MIDLIAFLIWLLYLITLAFFLPVNMKGSGLEKLLWDYRMTSLLPNTSPRSLGSSPIANSYYVMIMQPYNWRVQDLYLYRGYLATH